MNERKFARSRLNLLYKLTLIFSFITVFALDFLYPDLAERKFLSYFQYALALYFSLNLALFVLKISKKLRKIDRIAIILIQILVIPLAIICLFIYIKDIPLIINDFLVLLFFNSVFTALILLLKLILKIPRKYRLFFISKRFIKIASVFLFLALLVFLGRHYYFLQKRVARLEQIAGYKRIICDEKESIAKVKQSVVRIVGVVVEGSGFFVTSDGLIVTNHHVIAYDPRPKIIMPDYSLVQGEVLMADEQADLALVKIYNKQNLPAVTFADSNEIELMEELISIGYPFGTGLEGEATAVKGRFVALRFVREMGIDLVQTDMSLNPGSSGGPMIDACGKVVGINTVGTAGLGMGISANDFQWIWDVMAVAEEPLKDVEEIVFNPNGSAKECVEAFYNYQTIGKLEEAYNLLTSDYLDNASFENWKKGYQNTLNLFLYVAEEEDENTVFVKFSSSDLEGEEVVYRYFEGTLEVKEVDGNLKLDKHDIKEIVEPDWSWFYSI